MTMLMIRAASASAASRRYVNVSPRKRLLLSTVTVTATSLQKTKNNINNRIHHFWLQRHAGFSSSSSWQQSSNHHFSKNISQNAATSSSFMVRQQPKLLQLPLPSFLDTILSEFWFFSKDKKTMPRGFDDFFPPSNRHGKSLEDQQQQQQQQQKDASSSSSSSSQTNNSGEERMSSKNNNDSSSNNKKQSSSGGGKHNNDQNSNDNNTNNIPGMLAILALLVAIRTSMEKQKQELGKEITFTDFNRDYLQNNLVDKIIVVNNSVARIILKQNNQKQNLYSTQQHHEESLTLDHHYHSGSSSSSAGSSTSMDEQQQNHQNQHQHYFFYIGSVESLEEKLTRAQQHAHPQDWVQVQYVTRTNLATEFFKHLPLIAFTAAMYFGMRHVTGGASIMGGSSRGGSSGGGSSGGIFSIGKSPAKKIRKEDVNVSFADVAGCTQAKMEIMEFVDFLKDSSRFTKLGAKIPKGALLCGPPGTGKTLLAKAVAGEAGVPFYSISGSEFLEMFVGVGPSRVRDLFKEARQNTPCIIFIDEIDAVGRQRGRGGFSGGGNDERENTLNQLLVEMDGFSPTSGIVVLAGTNRVDILDQALTRPGRFDRQIQVDRPDLQGRKEIFQVHLRGIKLDQAEAAHANGGDDKAGSGPPIPIEDHYAGRLAGLTPGFAGADIANICNEAAIVAARRKADAVSMEDFDKATDRIIGGLESTKILSKEEQSIVAHHEAGHAVAGWFLEHADPLLKVTIIPRASGALGFAQYLPKEVFLRSRDQIMDIVCMALAGRAAEEVFFGQVTTGASDDLRRVTQLVYSMIKDYGMHDSVGQLAYPSQDDNNFGDKPYSDSTAEAMDDEARSIVNDAYQRTVALIREHQQDVDKVASVLLEKETITHDDLVELIGERPFKRDAAYDEYVRRRQPTPTNADKEELQPDSPPPVDDDSTVVGTGGLTPGLA